MADDEIEAEVQRWVASRKPDTGPPDERIPKTAMERLREEAAS